MKLSTAKKICAPSFSEILDPRLSYIQYKYKTILNKK